VFGKVFALAHRPGFAIHLQIIAARPYQMAAQKGSIDMQFRSTNIWQAEIFAHGIRHTGLWDIGWRESHRTNEARIQIMEHMALVPIHQDAATLASVAHLPIFYTDTPIFGYSFDQTLFPLFLNLHILLFDLLSDGERQLGSLRILLLQGLHPGFYGSSHVEDQTQCLVFLDWLIPITI
jgi:hypothetical protein